MDVNEGVSRGRAGYSIDRPAHYNIFQRGYDVMTSIAGRKLLECSGSIEKPESLRDDLGGETGGIVW